MFPLSKQDEFFVPQFCEDGTSIATSVTNVSTAPKPSTSSRVQDHEDESEVDKDGFVKPKTPVRASPRLQEQKKAVLAGAK